MCGVTNEPAHPSQHIYWIKKGEKGALGVGTRLPQSTQLQIKEKGGLRGRHPASTVNTITNKEKRGLRGGLGTRVPNQETIQNKYKGLTPLYTRNI